MLVNHRLNVVTVTYHFSSGHKNDTLKEGTMTGLIVAVVVTVVFFAKPTPTVRWLINYTKGCAKAWSELFKNS